MKRNILNVCLGAVALSGLLFVSCEKNEITTLIDVPVITASSTTIAAEGGTYNVTYSVSNPQDGATVSCSADVSWLSNITVSSGTVSFTASENLDDNIRTGNITIQYSYSGGMVSERAGVIQAGQASPVLNVQPNSIAAPYYGAACSFTYTVDNPATNGEISCTVDKDWVIDFDYSTSGTVKFVVTSNENGEDLRTAKIVVTYSASGFSTSKEVTVVQDHPLVEDIDYGNLTEVIGTYSATAPYVDGSGYDAEPNVEWTIRIYYNPSIVYDLYIDGMTPWGEGLVEYYQDQLYSAEANYTDGKIVVPSQCLSTKVTSGLSSYYLGFTPCTDFDPETGSAYYSSSFPDLVFTYNSSTDTWTSNYGEFIIGCKTNGVVSSMSSYFQLDSPPITMKRTSTSTSSFNAAPKGFHSIDEGLTLKTNFFAKD